MSAETSNSRKSLYNILFSVGSQAIIFAIGLILPRMFIVGYGSEVNGFLSSLGQVLTYVALLEAGVGTATLQSLYHPVATGDRGSINHILSATNVFYKRTGFAYLGCVVILAIVFPIFIKSDIPIWEQVAVILIVGGGGSIGYFVHAKYNIFFQAEGKTYVYTRAFTIVQVTISFSKVIMIMCGLNIVFIQLGHLVLNLVMAAYIKGYVKKHYPWMNVKSEPNFKAISKSKSVLVHQAAFLVFNNTDIIILTIFTNLKVVSVYTLYMMIVDVISTFIGNIHNGYVFRLGQLYKKDIEGYKTVFAAYETCFMALSMALYCVTFIFLLPFMKLYTAGVTDINYIMPLLPVLFVAIKVMVSGRGVCGTTMTFAEHFRETQYQAIIESVSNLVISIILVNFIGIYGVLVGTLVALLYRANDMIIYTNRKILHQSMWQTYKKWVLDFAIFIAVVAFSRVCPVVADGYLILVVQAAAYTAGCLILFGGINLLVFRKDLAPAVDYAKSKLKGFRKK